MENVISVCPQCGIRFFIVTEQGIMLQNCEHYVWHSNLGTIVNDEIRLQGGIRFRIVKR
jgi:hypothetical protein